MSPSIQDQILQLSIPEPNSGCWLWLGRVSNRRPFLGLKRAHRVSLAAFKGPIPVGLCACHTCHNQLCVNPDHLYAGTKKQNSEDMVRAGRHAVNNPEHREQLVARTTALNARRRMQTHCMHGHPLSGDNLYVRPSMQGSRTCRECQRIRQRKS